MAPQRSFWKGHLKLSLVTCPVAMTPATTSGDKVRFQTLNRNTGNPVASRYVDSVTGKPVAGDAEAKGYPRGEHEHVILDDDELAAVALDSARTIDIEMFVPARSMEWIWLDQPHYLVPDDAVGEEAFSVIRDAMASLDMVGIARLVLYRRERAVMLAARGKGIVLWTLRYGDEVRPAEPYFSGIAESKADARLMGLLKRLIDERTQAWDGAFLSDPVQDRLLEIIATRRKGTRRRARPKAAAAPAPSNVVSIMDALRNSIAAETRGKGKRR